MTAGWTIIVNIRSAEELLPGDEIIRDDEEGGWHVRRKVGPILDNVDLRLNEALKRAEGSASGTELAGEFLIDLDKHMRAGGRLPESWCPRRTRQEG